MSLLIGMASSPLPAQALVPWIVSFRRVCPDVDVLLLADPVDDYAVLRDYGVELRAANLHSDPADKGPKMDAWRGQVSVYKDRWRGIANAGLDGLPSDLDVLVTDTRDVVFQRDPFAQMPYGKLVVANEGVTYANDAWNRRYLTQFLPEYVDVLQSDPTICAGVIGGPAALIRKFAMQVHRLAEPLSGMADQACVNIVARTQMADVLAEMDYQAAWCCHCAQMWNAQTKRLHAMPRVGGRTVFAATPNAATPWTPFAIVHHWPFFSQLKFYADIGAPHEADVAASGAML